MKLRRIYFRGLASLLMLFPFIAYAAKPAVAAIPADKVNIVDKFERRIVSSDNIVATLQDCVPNAQFEDDPRQWPIAPASRLKKAVTSKLDRSHMLVSGNQAVCVQETAAGFPVLPVEALEQFTTFTGVGAAKQQQWLGLVAKSLANTGKAELVLAESKGKVSILKYEATPDRKGQITISQRTFKPGESVEKTNPQAINVDASTMTHLIFLYASLISIAPGDNNTQLVTLNTFNIHPAVSLIRPSTAQPSSRQISREPGNGAKP